MTAGAVGGGRGGQLRGTASQNEWQPVSGHRQQSDRRPAINFCFLAKPTRIRIGSYKPAVAAREDLPPGGRDVPIIATALVSALGWWLAWLAVARSGTWPYFVAYLIAMPVLMFGWGWMEERLGITPPARSDDELSASAVSAPFGQSERDAGADSGPGVPDAQPKADQNHTEASRKRGRAAADVAV